MAFRVTQSGLYSTALQTLRKQTSSLGKLQTQVLTGKTIVNPSDDPIGSRTIVLHKSVLGALDSRLTSIKTARNLLSQSEVQLTEAQDIFVRAREITLSARQSTDGTEIRTLATEVDRMLERLLSVANSKDQGLYLYSGNQSTTPPYTLEDGKVRYNGGGMGVSVPSGDGVELPMLYAGSDVFQDPMRETTQIFGKTGLKIGNGTDSGIGHAAVQITHTATTFSPGSGVLSGASGAAEDTLLGPVGTHSLVIRDTSGTGASGTISLNGGPEIAFTNSDADLKVTGPDGEVVYLDTRSITPGFNGTVDVGGSGTLSIDGGLTTVPLTYASEVQLVDSRTGEVTNLDTSSVTLAGTAEVEYSGTADAFTTLIELRDALRNKDNLTSGEWQEVMGRRLGDIERIQNHLYEVRGAQAVSQQQLNELQTRTEDLQLSTKQALSDVENVDITDVVVRLQEAQNQMQFALAAIAKLNDVNLLNYMQ